MWLYTQEELEKHNKGALFFKGNVYVDKKETDREGGMGWDCVAASLIEEEKREDPTALVVGSNSNIERLGLGRSFADKFTGFYHL